MLTRNGFLSLALLLLPTLAVHGETRQPSLAETLVAVLFGPWCSDSPPAAIDPTEESEAVVREVVRGGMDLWNDLMRSGKFEEALALIEKTALMNPRDLNVKHALAVSQAIQEAMNLCPPSEPRYADAKKAYPKQAWKERDDPYLRYQNSCVTNAVGHALQEAATVALKHLQTKPNTSCCCEGDCGQNDPIILEIVRWLGKMVKQALSPRCECSAPSACCGRAEEGSSEPWMPPYPREVRNVDVVVEPNHLFLPKTPQVRLVGQRFKASAARLMKTECADVVLLENVTIETTILGETVVLRVDKARVNLKDGTIQVLNSPWVPQRLDPSEWEPCLYDVFTQPESRGDYYYGRSGFAR